MTCDLDVIIFHFGTFFCLLPPRKIKILKTARKVKILKKWKKCLQKSSFYMVRDRHNCYFSFWVIFCSFTSLTAQKIKILTKMKKMPGDIIILHMCTKNYDQMMYSSWDMVHNRWKDRCTDRQMDEWKWHIDLGTSSKKLEEWWP